MRLHGWGGGGKHIFVCKVCGKLGGFRGMLPPLSPPPPPPPQDQEVFMDTLNTPTICKKLKKLTSQDPGESRRRWQHVTEALKRRDLEAAADAKHVVSFC